MSPIDARQQSYRAHSVSAETGRLKLRDLLHRQIGWLASGWFGSARPAEPTRTANGCEPGCRRENWDRLRRLRRGIWTNLFGGSKKNSEENSEK
jgi:hypothetical protein